MLLKKGTFLFCLVSAFWALAESSNGQECSLQTTPAKLTATLLCEVDIWPHFNWKSKLKDVNKVKFTSLQKTKLTPPTVFGPLPDLEEIFFENCQFDEIHEDFFSSLTQSIRSLVMKNVTVKKPLTSLHFKKISEDLTRLFISGPVLISPDFLQGSKHLKSLTLKRTPITEAPSNLVELLRNGLQELNLVETKIGSIPWPFLVDWSENEDSQSFDFTGSPLHCDVTLESVRQTIDETRPSSHSAKFTGLRCASPKRFAGKELKSIALEDLKQSIDETGSYDPNEPTDEDNPPQPATPINMASTPFIAVVVIAVIFICVTLLVVAVICLKRNSRRQYKSVGQHTSVAERAEPQKQGIIYQSNNQNV